MTEDFLPIVTIILPVRNEMRYIRRCLDTVIGQKYPHDRLEILVVDGMSEDGTRKIVEDFVIRDSRVRLLDNPKRIVPTALNKGIAVARGDVIIRVDGHAVIASDYVQRCVDDLARIDTSCVGGPVCTVGETLVARAIAVAQSSPFGVGNAVFRYATKPQYADTLAFGAHRRGIFAQVGLFDEELVRNQDDEFNFRLVRSGGRIWLDPLIHSTYYSRASLPALWKQYFAYGFWKVRVIQKHGRPASLRHLVPGIFAATLVATVIASILTASLLPSILIVAPYLFVSVVTSLRLAARKGWQYLPILPFAFGTMHLAYGIGFLFGVIRFGPAGQLKLSR